MLNTSYVIQDASKEQKRPTVFAASLVSGREDSSRLWVRQGRWPAWYFTIQKHMEKKHGRIS